MFAWCCSESAATAHSVDVISSEPAVPTSPNAATKQEEAQLQKEELVKKDAGEVQNAMVEVPPKPEVLDISLDKGDTMLGMALDLKAKGIQVLRIGAGAVERYNASVDQDRRVQPNDFIMAVNGAVTNIEMVKVMKSECTLSMKVLRAEPTVVLLKKAGKKLGCNLTYQEGQSIAVDITDINDDGIILDFNKSVPEPMQIKNGDCIQSVNGVSGAGAKIVEEIKRAEDLRIAYYRLELPTEEQ